MYLPSCQCGESGIRTHGPISESPVFKTGAFNHSAISPIYFATLKLEISPKRSIWWLSACRPHFVRGQKQSSLLLSHSAISPMKLVINMTTSVEKIITNRVCFAMGFAFCCVWSLNEMETAHIYNEKSRYRFSYSFSISFTESFWSESWNSRTSTRRLGGED